MSYEEKFNAAVNVIRNLPKNGAYQPSHELMLRFYAYYKQATEGPNTMPKPSFWEVIKRAKWDAWTKLGNMSREQAMISYVDELKKIVETMAYTDNVATFITSLDSFYESVPAEDLHMLIGPVIEKVRSQPGSPLTGSPLSSREVSPQRVSTKTSTKHITSSLETSPASSYSASPLPPDTDEEEDFLDTFEQTEPERVANGVKDSNANVAVKNKHNESPYKAMNGHTPLMANGTATPDKGNANDRNSRHRETRTNTHNGHINNNNNNTNKGFYTKNSKGTVGGGGGGVENGNVEPVLVKSESDNHSQTAPVNSSETEIQRTPISDVDVSEVIRQTLSSLRNDLESLNIRMNTIERNCQQMANSVMKKKKPSLWWPLDQVPVPAAVFFIVWPFVVQALILWIQRRKRRA